MRNELNDNIAKMFEIINENPGEIGTSIMWGVLKLSALATYQFQSDNVEALKRQIDEVRKLIESEKGDQNVFEQTMSPLNVLDEQLEQMRRQLLSLASSQANSFHGESTKEPGHDGPQRFSPSLFQEGLRRRNPNQSQQPSA